LNRFEVLIAQFRQSDVSFGAIRLALFLFEICQSAMRIFPSAVSSERLISAVYHFVAIDSDTGIIDAVSDLFRLRFHR
jgi:hypothetical protein